MTDAGSTSRADDPVTVVISREVRPGREADYEAWLEGISAEVARFPGHEGISILRPADHAFNEYVLVLRFVSYDDLGRWRGSPERRDWIDQLGAMTVDRGRWQEQTGLETWFTLPGRPVPTGPPPRWKQAILTTVGLVPLLWLSNATLGRAVGGVLPGWLATLLVTPLLVALMTWVVMPPITRGAYRWLYPED